MLKGLVDFVDRINNQGITYFYNVFSLLKFGELPWG